MVKTTGRILKSTDIKFEGSLHLDARQTTPRLPQNKDMNLAAPQAHIVEKHPEFAVIEITCCCGTKTYLRCEYAGGNPLADQNPEQTD